MGIVENLAKILSSRYGKDVRQAIHDSIEEGYNIATDAKTAAITAQNSAAASATAAGNSASAANDSKVAAAGSAAEAKHYAESIGGALRPMGTITFSQLPALATATAGDCYNISDAFTTTSDFEEGAGVKVPAGANVYKTVGGKWDVLAGAYVTGVKGSAEANYRTGEVEITKANIGLGDVPNTDFTAPVSTLNEDVAWYGTSSTAAATQAKIATTTDTKFKLVTGAKVKIKFTYENTHASPTLNVDSKGAKSIKAYGTTAPTIWWSAGDVVEFTYDGTNWIMGACGSQINQLNDRLLGAVVSGTTGCTCWKVPLTNLSPGYGLVIGTIEINLAAADVVNGHVLASGLPRVPATIYLSAGTTGGNTIPLAISNTAGGGKAQLAIYYPSLAGVAGRIDLQFSYLSYE